jgi:hypothetical protein
MKKKFTPVFIGLLLLSKLSYSQYCMLPGETPYSPLQPGITNFKLNGINRTSSNSESAGSVVVTTGLSTTLTAGQTYTVSISHSEDTQFFPGARNNIRVWIDYNNNLSFIDAGETVVLVDLEAPATTYTAVFTVPASTPAGTVALRATAKMSADAGHTLPTPCNVPADPLGYHGEMEDYSVVIQPANPGQSPTAIFYSHPQFASKQPFPQPITLAALPSLLIAGRLFLPRASHSVRIAPQQTPVFPFQAPVIIPLPALPATA